MFSTKIPAEFEYHDHWLAVVASVHGGVHAVHEPLVRYRQHGGNVVGVTPYPGFLVSTVGYAPMRLIGPALATYQPN